MDLSCQHLGNTCQLNLYTGIGYILPTIGGYMSVGGFLPQGPTVRGPIVHPEKVDSWAPDSWALWQCIKSTDICSPNDGSTYPIQIYTLQNVHSLTLRPKGRTENLQLTYVPKCWPHLSNTNIYITTCTFPNPGPKRAHRKPPIDIYPPNVGSEYSIKIYIIYILYYI